MISTLTSCLYTKDYPIGGIRRRSVLLTSGTVHVVPCITYGLIVLVLVTCTAVRLLKFMAIVGIRMLNIYAHGSHWYDPSFYGPARWLKVITRLVVGYAFVAARLRCIFSKLLSSMYVN
jgi:hypothetical protein